MLTGFTHEHSSEPMIPCHSVGLCPHLNLSEVQFIHSAVSRGNTSATLSKYCKKGCPKFGCLNTFFNTLFLELLSDCLSSDNQIDPTAEILFF